MSSSSSGEEEQHRQDVFTRLQELRANESDAKRKRREDLLGRANLRAQQRRQTSSLISSVRLDLSEVHSKLSGPRLTWDFDSGQDHALEIDADRFGGSGTRAALHQHIKQQLSQASAKQLARQIQSQSAASRVSSPEEADEPADAASSASSHSDFDQMPELIPVSPVYEDPVSEGELPRPVDDYFPPAPTQPYMRSGSYFASQSVAPTQPYIHRRSQAQGHSPARSDATEPLGDGDSPARVKGAELAEEDDESRSVAEPPRRVLQGPLMSDSMFDFRGPLSGLRSQRVSESPRASESPEESPEDRAQGQEQEEKGRLSQEEKARRRAERKLRKKELRKNLRGFVEDAAEESDDEEFASFTRKRRQPGNSGEENSEFSDSDSDSDVADLEGLVASEDEELKLKGRAEKDQRKLSKLHGLWAEERDKELEERVEKGEFRKRRKTELWGEEAGGVSRRERMRRAKYDSNGERILSSEDESSDGELEDEEDWLTEEEDEWRAKDKRTKTERKRREVIKQIAEEKVLRQKNVNTMGLLGEERREYESSVKEVSVFGIDKTTRQETTTQPVFSFLAQKNHKSIGFR